MWALLIGAALALGIAATERAYTVEQIKEEAAYEVPVGAPAVLFETMKENLGNPHLTKRMSDMPMDESTGLYNIPVYHLHIPGTNTIVQTYTLTDV